MPWLGLGLGRFKKLRWAEGLTQLINPFDGLRQKENMSAIRLHIDHSLLIIRQLIAMHTAESLDKTV